MLTSAGPDKIFDTPDDITAGDEATYTVTRYDQFGNLQTIGAETVYLYSSAAGANDEFRAVSLGAPVTSIGISDTSNNVQFFYYDEVVAASITITASDATPTADGTTNVDDDTDIIAVTPDVTASYTLDSPDEISLSVDLILSIITLAFSE